MKIIEVITETGHLDTIVGIAEQYELYYRLGAEVDQSGQRAIRLLVEPEKRQAVLDALQNVLSTSETSRIIVIPTEVVLPRKKEEKGDDKESDKGIAATREELYHQIEKGARLDSTFLLLVLFSTIVATIGLIEDNVAVVIGAMVIAPLLGPNIALALAGALGDTALAWQALRCNFTGLAVALLSAVVIGLLWPVNFESQELLARTDIGLDGIVLALASGAAAVLSLTTGLSSVLVGVMVAVALLPPTATMGLMLGSGQYNLAFGAGLLLMANVVCVNLAAKLVFLFKGVKPRTWLEKRKARQSMLTYLVFWLVLLFVIMAIILIRTGGAR